MSSVYNLEHCYTNLFSLTDLNGIKWLKIQNNNNNDNLDDDNDEDDDELLKNSESYLKDSILKIYSKCLKEDILCSWKRKQANIKELWLFWYDKEPSNIRTYIKEAENVKEIEQGSWDSLNDGLSYELRIAFFKALFNFIEKTLMLKGYARLERWFLKPYRGIDCLIDEGNHASYSFNFFLHGISKVCTSVEVKMHKSIRTLNKNDLNTFNLQVILSPYAVQATLCGFLPNDHENSRKTLDEWRLFYPLRHSIDMPRVVIVQINSQYRLFYPTCYVFVLINADLKPKIRSTLDETIDSVARGGLPSSLSPNKPKKHLKKDLNFTQSNQIKLKHQEIELNNESIELAFELIDESSEYLANLSLLNDQHLCLCKNTNKNLTYESYHKRGICDLELKKKPLVETTSESSDENDEEFSQQEEDEFSLVLTRNLNSNKQNFNLFNKKFNENDIDLDIEVIADQSKLDKSQMDDENDDELTLSMSDSSESDVEMSTPKKSVTQLAQKIPLVESNQPKTPNNQQMLNEKSNKLTLNELKRPLLNDFLDKEFLDIKFDTLYVGDGLKRLKSFDFVHSPGIPSEDYLTSDNKTLITPPHSVGDLTNFDPKSNTFNKSSFISYQSTTQLTKASYDDLNQIFDDDLTDTIDTQDDIAISKQSQMQTQMISLKTIAECSSVMTPPSHETLDSQHTSPITNSVPLEPQETQLSLLNNLLQEKSSFRLLNNEKATKTTFNRYSTVNIEKFNYTLPTWKQANLTKTIKKEPQTINSSTHLHVNGISDLTLDTYGPLSNLTTRFNQQQQHFTPISSPFQHQNSSVLNETLSLSFADSPSSQKSLQIPLSNKPSPAQHQQKQVLPKTPQLPQQHIQQTQHQHPQAVTQIKSKTQLNYTELNSITYNLYLSDTLLNIYRDINFDSCTLCVCKNNIEGIDYPVYLHFDGLVRQFSSNSSITSQQSNNLEDPNGYKPPCTCGFSSIINRRLAINSGLFYEDYVEIMNIKRSALQNLPIKENSDSSIKSSNFIMELFEYKFSCPFLTLYESNELQMMFNRHSLVNANETFDSLRDENLVCINAIDNLLQNDVKTSHSSELISKKWLLNKNNLKSNVDITKCLKYMQPLLDEALRKRHTSRTQSVQGPMTWQHFCRISSNPGFSFEPEPIPSLLVSSGNEHEWLTISPYAIKYWDKLNIEPYSKQKNISYVVISPDNEKIISETKKYFRELNASYELNRFGYHRPALRLASDQGIYKISNKNYELTCKQLASTINTNLGNIDSNIFEVSKLGDRLGTNYEDGDSQQQQQSPVNNDESSLSKDDESINSNTTTNHRILNPFLIIYLIDSADSSSDTSNNLTLFKAYCELINSIPEKIRVKTVFQIIPLKVILDLNIYTDDDYKANMFRSQVFNTFTLTKRTNIYGKRVETLTGFGPAALEAKFIRENKKILSQILKIPSYSPPFILAPCLNSIYRSIDVNTSSQQQAQDSKTATNKKYPEISGINSNQLLPNFLHLNSVYQEQCNVLYVAYCLSEDQTYLLASCCDEQGELLETQAINIEISQRSRRKQFHARRLGLRKLWEFILHVIAQTCKPWRLVIGRLGRLGHSELRGWGCLLSKKNLQRSCNLLKDTCDNCTLLGNTEMPCILSACLISLETCSNLCIYPESYSREDKTAAGQQSSQQTQGVSCTHILTFPTSAIIQTQSVQQTTQNEQMKNMQMDDFLNFFGLEEEDNLIGNDILASDNDPSNKNGLNGDNMGTSMQDNLKQSKEQAELLLNQEEIPHLDQQPLAIGYYISTAKCGLLPKWLLQSNSHLDSNSHTFKATLHLHSPYALESDDMQVKSDHSHRLDSSVTYEVLRYVLERYNALSWLNIDLFTQDRKSCLPLNYSVLLQLYHAFNSYI